MSSAWRLSGYRIETLLGIGGFGEVWRATVRSTGTPVALKRIRLTDPARRERAVSEAAVLGALDHPHLIRLRHVEGDDDAVVLVLDLAGGGSLHVLLAARGRLTTGEVVTTMAAVADAVAHAHAAKIVHGDVTPANILFSDDGLPLLGDLGTAALIGDAKPVHTTLPYAAPEVIAGATPDPAADVYMLGACALESLTGHAPPSALGEFDADVWAARVLAQLTRVDVPPPVAAIVGRAMSLDPQSRGTSAGFALDLRHAARPAAVELRAGRSRTEPSLARLAALAVGEPVCVEEPPAPVADWAPPERAVARAVPTPGVHRPRHASPTRSGGRPAAPAHPRRPARVLAVTAAAALVSMIGCGAWWWAGSSNAGDLPVAQGRPAPRVTPDTRQMRVDAASVGPLSPAAVLAALGALDRARSQAFARRDPQLLTRVYASAVLLARDRAELFGLVPPGCGLLGVRTDFGSVRMARADASRAAFAVSSTLAASRLECGGRPAGAAAGAAAVRLEITLVRGPAGWRIANQQAVRG